jgi:TAP42-like family
MSKSSGGDLIAERQDIRASVFRPRMAPPTMTLEEFGDIEKANAEARSAAEASADKPVRRYSHLLADGDEDDDDLVDQVRSCAIASSLGSK